MSPLEVPGVIPVVVPPGPDPRNVLTTHKGSNNGRHVATIAATGELVEPTRLLLLDQAFVDAWRRGTP